MKAYSEKTGRRSLQLIADHNAIVNESVKVSLFD